MGILKLSAEGSASRKPDIVFINISFEFKENEYMLVLEKGTKFIKDFNELLKSIKVDEKQIIFNESIKTNGFHIIEKYKDLKTDEINEYGKPIYKKVFDGFYYNQSLKIKIDYNLKYLEEFLSKIEDIENFNSINISFGINDLESLKDEAIVDAIEKCKRKASLLANAANKKLDDLKEISYNVKDINDDFICNRMSSFEATQKAVQKKISLCDVINPDDIIIKESIICIFEID